MTWDQMGVRKLIFIYLVLYPLIFLGSMLLFVVLAIQAGWMVGERANN